MPTEATSDGAEDSSAVPSVEQPELDLVALRALDEAAWTLAFKKLWPLAMMAARSQLKCDSDAEEAANDALEQLVSQMDRVLTLDDLHALTYTIAQRRAISTSRRNSAVKRSAERISLNDDPSDQHPLFERLAASENTLSEVESAECLKLLQEALGQLDRSAATLIEEKIMFGKTYEELGATHKIPANTACTKVTRGLDRLASIIENSPILKKELHNFLR